MFPLHASVLWFVLLAGGGAESGREKKQACLRCLSFLCFFFTTVSFFFCATIGGFKLSSFLPVVAREKKEDEANAGLVVSFAWDGVGANTPLRHSWPCWPLRSGVRTWCLALLGIRIHLFAFLRAPFFVAVAYACGGRFSFSPGTYFRRFLLGKGVCVVTFPCCLCR